MKKFFDVAVLVVDSHHGVYSASIFAGKYEAELLKSGVSQDDLDILKSAVEKYSDFEQWDEYWDIWDAVENKIIVVDGVNMCIAQVDGDIYIYPCYEQIDWDEVF